MKNSILLSILLLFVIAVSCTNQQSKKSKSPKMKFISESVVESTIDSISKKLKAPDTLLIRRGVEQVAGQWRAEDGTEVEFANFCKENFMNSAENKRELFNKLSTAFETLWGHYNEINLGLKKPLHLDGAPLTKVDYIFGAYDPSSHMNEDLYNNKIAYISMLNFPFYSLQEKDSLGERWSRIEWAYARIGDVFIPKAPSAVKQKVADAEMAAENYIAEYNIMMGSLVDKSGDKLFPKDMKLLSHWNLRDEIKSNYATQSKNLEKQRMIYKVMERIVDQTIPLIVINNSDYEWNPFDNQVKKAGKVVEAKPEDFRRYEMLLNQFKAQKSVDEYSFAYPTAIKRAFDAQMQITAEEIESIFTELLSSPKVKVVAKMIEERLGRPLEPFDIWYDGFKSRSSISQEKLDAQTLKLFPTAESYDKAIPSLLTKFGFAKDKSEQLGSAIVVEAARGSGHAWGAQSRTDQARLRTRLSSKGMDYKGFNIAVHEMGHNVEQTISMRDVDYYILNGVPNTAFTEALAFVFQKRDLSLLGYNNIDPNNRKMVDLDIFWGSYEIMGVALVDINVWRWLYANPNATAQELKEAVIKISQDIWNKYYASVLGAKNSSILAIYSHMINSPLYLANYPFGHIIEFQLERYFENKKWTDQVIRMYALGNITPQQWMLNATGEKISVKSMLE